MKYVITKDIAILSTRGVETIDEQLDIVFVGAEENSAFRLRREDGSEELTYPIEIIDGAYTATVSGSVLDEGIYAVEIVTEDNIIPGTTLKILKNLDGKLKCIPAPQASGVEVEKMWIGVCAILETLIEHIDEHKNGYEII